MIKAIFFLLLLSISTSSLGQNNTIKIYDLADGKADQARDCNVDPSGLYVNTYYFDGSRGVSGLLSLQPDLDTLYLSPGDAGFTIDDNMTTDGRRVVVAGEEANSIIKVIVRDSDSGAIINERVIVPEQPQTLFAKGISVLDSQYVLSFVGAHDTSMIRSFHTMSLYYLDKQSLSIDTIIDIYSSPNGSMHEIKPYGDNGIVALVDTTFIPDWWMSGPNTSWVSRQLLTFDGHYQQRELYRVDEIRWGEQWGNCLVTLPNGNVVVTVAYSEVGQNNLECINPDGEVVWDFLFPTEWYTLIALTNLSLADNGDILGSGLVNRSVPEIGILFRLSPDGELRWIRQYEMPAPERWMDISFADVNQLDDDRLVVVGHVTVTETLDPTDNNYYPNQNTLIMTVDNDGCYNGDCSDIIQLDMEDLIVTSTVDVDLDIEVKDNWLYPNPVTTNTIYFTTPLTADLTLYDLTGRIVLTQSLDQATSTTLDNLRSGMYVITASRLDGTRLTNKIVVP